MKKFSVLLVLVIVTMFSGCSSDDSSSTATGNTINLTMNGENITATITSATLIKSEASNEKLLEVTAETTDYKFTLNFFSTYSADDAIPTGNYVYDDTTSDGFVYVSYKRNGNTYGMHFPETGNLNIASINGGDKKVTGTFSQTLTGGGDIDGEPTPNELVITGGTFSNIPYTVVIY